MHSVGGTLGPMFDSLSGQGGPHLKTRKERKLSLLLRRTADPVHCSGIESLAISGNGSTIYTASRDATVRSWSAEEPLGRWQSTFEGHSNWVNDVLCVGDALVSCSSDCSIAIWDAQATVEVNLGSTKQKCHKISSAGLTTPECKVFEHTDYVMCLAAAKDVSVVVSGGLRGQVLLWDLSDTFSRAQSGQAMRSIDQSSSLGSVYALDINARGNAVAIGSPEGLLRISDARSPSKSFKLRGHSDNIRALLLNDEATLCLSASSDNTIRLWDLGQQRCVQTFAVHTDSVWTLQASPDFSTIYSGGRDSCIYRTHVASRSSELLVEEGGPVTKLAMGLEGQLWAATTGPTVNCWQIPPPDWGPAHPLPTSPRTPASRHFHAGPSPQLRHRQRFSSGKRPEAADTVVCGQIKGIPPLIRFATLEDRRHVLTQDSDGKVALWDVTCGAIVQQFGKADIAAKEKELFTPESVAPWFTADVKLGSLAVHLEPPSCFAAELYATELGREDCADDLKYNFGENLLKAAFEQWVKGLAAAYVSLGTANGAGPAELAAAVSCFQLQGEVPPLLTGQLQGDGNSAISRPWAKAVNELDGTEKIGELIPKWVAEAILYHRYPVPPELKCAFLLLPAEGSGLPSLLQSRLNAPRILKVSKVATYVAGKLADDGLAFEPRHLFYNPTWQAELEARRRQEAGGGDLQEVEFVCNGTAVPFDLSLGAVKRFIWRRSDTLIIHFRAFNAARPAPRPAIKPPGG